MCTYDEPYYLQPRMIGFETLKCVFTDCPNRVGVHGQFVDT
jgi:hypothetical protein